MVTSRIERMVRQVRQWRPLGSSDTLRLDPTLPDGDRDQLISQIDDCLRVRGGEVAARRRAQAIATAFLDLDTDGRRRFFELLATRYGPDAGAVDHAIEELTHAEDDLERNSALFALRRAVHPGYEALLKRFVSFDGGLAFVVAMREDLLDHRRTDPALDILDTDLRLMLEDWFDVGLMTLEEITWDSPAALLEKLIEYEAVHAIESWDDLRGRLGPGRRCYAFVHPSMAGDPLIFVEVALVTGTPSELGPLLDHDRKRIDESEADTAVFYSISNCHRGLSGVSLGDFLIKQVVERLTSEVPSIRHFVTLSPIPGFRSWLEHQPDAPALPRQPITLEDDREQLMGLAARYLTQERRKGRAADPVAHFHLSNGARVERLNWWANPAGTGWDRSLGMMVNYYYRPKSIEENHDRYLAEGTVPMSDDVRKLLDG